jgi:HEPN domain-containing protein
LKVLLTFYQVEFPKTHEIERLLALVSNANPEAADALGCAKWVGPFAVDIRYPGDAVEMLPGGEVKAIEIAQFVKSVVLRTLDEG